MALRLLLLAMLVAAVTHGAPITRTGCITDCVGRTTGDYQSCLGCHVYASCVSGNLFDNRPCPTGLVWDDNAKRCLTTSSTCQPTTTTRAPTTTNPHPSTPSPSTSRPEITTEATTGVMGEKSSNRGVCVTSCRGRKDGDYQSCNGCHVYASCVNGILIDNRPCPSGLVWDDKAKQCRGSSSTCPGSTTTKAPTTTTTTSSPPTNNTMAPSTSQPEGTTDGSDSTPSSNITAAPNTSLEEAMPQSLCVSSCSGRKDGDYQSCNGCHVYCSCLNGILIDNRPCPSGLVWDDKAKQCLRSSSTCSGSTTTTTTTTTQSPPTNITMAPSTPQPEFTTGSKTSPSPSSTIAASPSSSPPEVTTVATTDIQEKVISNQGLCVSSCVGRTTGDYQSCLGCHVYASCVSGNLFDNRPCPTGLVWDDNAKRCLTTSSTCQTSTTRAPTTATTHPSRPSPSTSRPEITSEATTAVMGEKSSNRAVCVTSCSGHKDGDYQSCNGCHIYASCVNGILIDNRPCPSGLVWNNKVKQCRGSSSTCPGSTTTKAPTTTTTQSPPTNITMAPSTPQPEFTTGSKTSPTPSSTIAASPSSSPPEVTTVATTDIQEKVISNQGLCVSSCVGRTTGDYQSCLGCHVYASCVSGNLFDNRLCPTGLVWDDNAKRCLTTSSTCQPTTTTTTKATTMTTSTIAPTGSPASSTATSIPGCTTEPSSDVTTQMISQHELCITNCIGRTTGDYQSCLGCHVYASCVSGNLFDNRPCPTGLVWDDAAKRCLTTSSTCQPTTTTRAPTTTPPHPSTPSTSTSRQEITSEATTGVMGEKSSNRGVCVTSCSGRKDGDYQSCNGCHVYVSCVNGMLINNRPCPAGLVWDDNAKTCLRTSSTCQTSTTTKAPTTTTTSEAGGTQPASTTHPETTATHTDAAHTTQDGITRTPHH